MSWHLNRDIEPWECTCGIWCCVVILVCWLASLAAVALLIGR